MLFVKIKLVGHGTYIQPVNKLEPLIGEIEEGTIGEKWTIEIVEMSQEEYNALSEFLGH